VNDSLALAILIVAIAIVAGVHQGRRMATRWTRFVTAVVIMAVANLLVCWPDFVGPNTWHVTYLGGLAHLGLVSFFVFVVPFLVTFHFVRSWQSKKDVGEERS
jgi:hypothetical protein